MTHKSAKRKVKRSTNTTMQVTVTLDRDVVEMLDAHAEAEGRTRSNAASRIIRGALGAAKQAG